MDEFQNPSIFDDKKYYQWKAGLNIGNVEVYVAELNDVIWFESGKTCPKDRFDELLIEISEQEYNIQSEKTRDFIQPVIEEVTAYNNIPLGNPEPPKKEANPIRIILDKQKKLDNIKINYPVFIELPSKKVIEFLTMMFDEDEVTEEITKFILEKIDASLISDFKTFITNYIKIKL